MIKNINQFETVMYDLIANVRDCYIELPNLLYYSHIPLAFASLLLGIFVLVKRKTLAGKALFFITLCFSLWSAIDLVLWVSVDSRVIGFFWSIVDLLDILLFISSLYFVMVFIDNKDVSFSKKVVFFAFLLPIIVLMPTKYYIGNFDGTTCNAVEYRPFLNYIFFVEIFFSGWILAFAVNRWRKSGKIMRKQISLLTSGIALFLLSFFLSGFLADEFENFRIEQYGLFGAFAFITVLAYLIVRFEAFSIKILGAQALVYTIVILIGSQLFFIKTVTNFILTGVTLILTGIFGSVLIASVRLEVRRKEELQYISHALTVTNQRLKSADDSKNEFLSIASHQLRTPLTVIKGYIALMFDGSYGKIPESIEQVMKNIMVSNNRLIELVEDLLNISRMESGRMEYRYAPTDIMDLLKELCGTFIVKANDRPEIEVRLVKPPVGLPDVMTDCSKLREVVSNLIDNAIKYTPKGLVTVKAFRKDGDTVRIEVKDSGIGIPATEMPYLFAKFSRGKDIGRLNAGGTGLGLHVGKSMIESMGGKVWAESEGDKKGSTFIVELPIHHEEGMVKPAAPAIPTLSPDLPTGPAVSGSGAQAEAAEPAKAESPLPDAAAGTDQPGIPVPSSMERPILSDDPEPAPRVTEVTRMEPLPQGSEADGDSEPETEGRIIFKETRRGNRIV